jgi:hypothetical protein
MEKFEEFKEYEEFKNSSENRDDAAPSPQERVQVRIEELLETSSYSSNSCRLPAGIVPFVALCYFVCYLDRVNVGCEEARA